MIDVALNILAVIAGGVTLELFVNPRKAIASKQTLQSSKPVAFDAIEIASPS
jgi:hypothetical protein